MSEETKEKLRQINLGKVMSKEARIKMVENRKELSDETREKMSAWQKGVPKSSEHKEKISQSMINSGVKAGKNHPLFGVKMSDETKAKLGAANKKRWEEKRLLKLKLKEKENDFNQGSECD